MNTVLLNTVNLDDGRIIKKGGGGVTIKNQTKSVTIAENGNTVVSYDSGYTGLEKVSVKVDISNEEKTVEITENGTTEVVADNGFLSKVVVNTNVASGGGGGSDMPVIGDGKTYLYIKIAEKGRMKVPLYFSQTVANGVAIDWGDGSVTQTLSGTGNVNTTHTYADVGDYVISLNPADGCILGLGRNSSSYCVMGGTGNIDKVYCNMLQAVEIGKNVKKIDKYTFSYCQSLTNVVIPDSVTIVNDYVFYFCYSLKNVVLPNNAILGSHLFEYCYTLTSITIPNGLTTISDYMFNACSTLTSIVIPDSVTNIGSYAFYKCYSLTNIVIPYNVTNINSYAFYECFGVAFYDFRASKSVPTLTHTNAFYNIPLDCKIVVPDALYDEWIAATNWSTYASKMVKASEFNV